MNVDEAIDHVVAKVVGTCSSLDVEEELSVLLDREVTDNELAIFDSLAFNCCICGWWFETSERSDIEDDLICVECESR